MIKSQPYQHPSLTFRSPTSPPPSSFPISSVVSPTQSLSSSFGPFQQQSSRPFPQSLTSTTSPPPLSDSIQLNSSTNSTLQSISSSPPGSSSLSSSPPSLSSSVSQHHQLQPSSINSIINSTSNIIPLQSASSSIMSHNLQSSNFFQPFPSAATPNNSQYSQSHSFASNPSSMSLTTNNPSMSFSHHHQQQPQSQSSVPLPSLNSSSSTASAQNSFGFYPNTVTSPLSEDLTSTANYPYLRILNLPRDIQEREFAVMFTFANNFSHSEIQRSPPTDNGLPSSVVGIAYFKTLAAATTALATLSRNVHLFTPKEYFSQSNSFSSPFAIKIELINNGHNISHESLPALSRLNSFNAQPQQQNTQPSQNQSQSSQQPSQGQQSKNVSRFVFSGQHNNATASGMSASIDMQNTFSDMYDPSNNASHSHPPPGTGIFSPPPSRGILSMHPQSQNSQQRQLDDFTPRMSGKSLLLESQGHEDEEYNDIVKDVGWYSQTGNANNNNSITGYSRTPNSASSSLTSPIGYNNLSNQNLASVPNLVPSLSQTLHSQQQQQHKNQGTQKSSQKTSPKQMYQTLAQSVQQTQKSNKHQTPNPLSPTQQSQNKGTNGLAKGNKIQDKTTVGNASATNGTNGNNSGNTNGNTSNNNNNNNNANNTTNTSNIGYKHNGRSGNGQSINAGNSGNTNQWVSIDANIKKNRQSTARSFQNLSLNVSTSNSGNNSSGSNNSTNRASPIDGAKIVVPYSPTNNSNAIHIMQNGGRVLPPANPADQNPPCNTLYVGNLPLDTNEDELKKLFSKRRGYKRLCFRTKANGPMCFVEFEDVNYATRALEELYGYGLSNSVKGGIRLSFSKNPLGVRSQPTHNNNNNNGNNNHNGTYNNSGNTNNGNGNNNLQCGTTNNQNNGLSSSNFGSGNNNNGNNNGGNSFNASLRSNQKNIGNDAF